MNTSQCSVEKKRWLLLNQMEGHLAMWAVRQSPYHCPDKLAEVISAFRQRQLFFFDKSEMANFSRSNIRAAYETLKSIPEFEAWNERKNGNKSPFGFVDRYSKPNPDNDFIDLDALIGNATRSLWNELETE